MDKKQHILNEIKRIAEKNRGNPLGKDRFFAETGIKQSDWYGKSWNDWNSWGDVLKESGYEPNQKQEAFTTDFLIKNLIALTRKLGRFPLQVELRRESARNKDFPMHTVWVRRLGDKDKRIEKVIDFCRQNSDEYQDVLDMFEPLISKSVSNDDDVLGFRENENFGFVYLMKSGKYYKIGKTNALDRWQYEIGIQLPEKIDPIHSIRTDDPSGIEAYWHGRFKDKRLNGEWFSLAASDVSIFKKRKFM